MKKQLTALKGASILEGGQFCRDKVLLLRGARLEGIVSDQQVPPEAVEIDLAGGYLVPGFVDLQVNGGGGVMLNDTQDLATLRTIAQAHAAIGATSILPTLITDTPGHVQAAIRAVEAALAADVPGILGLHLEGPHLSKARKGAHDAALIRPMSDTDLELLLQAASRLPVLKITVAPETVTNAQIATLSGAGVLVSLGHTEADFDTCAAAAKAGARCVTHLFNAQSQITGREPGTVGAALALGGLSAGLIADGIHVHPASMSLALQAKCGPGQIFLVSDAMATAGSEIESFSLNGRQIHRSGNRLSLADGTLAGAHLELASAVGNLVEMCGLSLEQALAMAGEVPAALIGAAHLGSLAAGRQADVLHLNAALQIQTVWQRGCPV
ncbi:N-acetylglucosamine-6-phosphate deacetylase [Parasedimentitalea psychrophila]|uniref:N-acetylglucosamine-6-phosphate deacetylase n=1 Tax=Parasedimentitalea psychrophila TaxID=2997337 RepID=A0A9Y2P1Y0_9RHOB|nr:N-acetylglucosamine-6-phosphate deacetylase [Parasedimentitalea psychrophila]WIY26056.1 N-acetylglucosamine-6-phosphate deacetylase [Parasedimentitalea psychrophila]